jgi:putative ABC transport system ATP-binding protein
MNNTPLILLQEIYKTYHTGKVSFEALKDITLTINKGEYLAILGPSGSGKSTLMQILGCLSTPTSGSYLLDGKEVSKLTRNELAKVRNQKIGFVFQSFNLLGHLTALENAALPLVYRGESSVKRYKLAREMLTRLNLETHLDHRPNELSGGQQQRVAISRALINNPEVILADEPTGNLDTKSGSEVINIFEKLAADGKTIIIVTHDLTLAERTKRVIRIRDGLLVES